MEDFARLQAELSRRCPELELRAAEPMFKHTSFRIGGPAALMALPRNEQEAAAAVRIAHELGVEPFFLGNGSNLLVSDEGIRRFVVKAGQNWSDCTVEGNVIRAAAGITLARLAVIARDNGLTGLEFSHGIPGTLGGAVTMNAGAYGGEMCQVVKSVTCLTMEGKLETVTDFDFGYRHSAFSDGRRLVTSVELELRPGDRAEIQNQMEDLAFRRKSKQPLEYPSAGSMFKRPAGHYAAALIDQCGLKGFSVGGAQVSEKHAGFVVNKGGATCADVLELVRQVHDRVRNQTGVELEMEVRVLGEQQR